jgi:AcrR family transcriptional regulator
MAQQSSSQADHPASSGVKRLSGLGLPTKVVEEDQRRRILVALGEAVAKHGYGATTVRRVIEPAGVSRRTFYDFYGGKEDAFCAAHGEALDLLGERVSSACERERQWPCGVAAAIAATLQWVAAEPRRAHLVVAESLIGGPRPTYCHDLLVARFAPLLRRGRGRPVARFSQNLEDLLISGLTGIIAARLRAGQALELPKLAPQLTEFVLTPYLGAEKAVAMRNAAT